MEAHTHTHVFSHSLMNSALWSSDVLHKAESLCVTTACVYLFMVLMCEVDRIYIYIFT